MGLVNGGGDLRVCRKTLRCEHKIRARHCVLPGGCMGRGPIRPRMHHTGRHLLALCMDAGEVLGLHAEIWGWWNTALGA